MSRRKHLMQQLAEEVEPPGEGQHIVRALGSRGSNIIEVEFPDGRTTLVLLPAKFHKKLWILKGSFVIIEEEAQAGAEGQRVTGFVHTVLYTDHVKQLKRMPGIWPSKFVSSSGGGASQAAEQLAALGLSETSGEEHAATSSSAAAAGPPPGQEQGPALAASAAPAAAAAGEAAQGGEGSEGYSSSEDDLPPIPRFNNRNPLIEYEVSESDSDDE